MRANPLPRAMASSLTPIATRTLSRRLPRPMRRSLTTQTATARPRLTHPARRPQHQHHHCQTQPLSTFLTSLLPSSPNPQSTPLQSLHARRILPYPPSHLYTLISDIDAYRFFLPNCTASRVTAWTRPSPQKQKHPAQADLTIGWGPFTQSYTSRVYCVPGSVVEAVSGSAHTTIPSETLREVGYDDDHLGVGLLPQKGGGTGIFESLVTRWTVTPVPVPGTNSTAATTGKAGGKWTEVTLSVQFRFANPALGFAVGQLADDKVDEMVQAFEERARRLYKG
ncbi:coenzyme Q-binding protein COQ10, mitochondrial [Echria macrotheca]|uniref:Coenzyme Q-binding protein COQ10, mitochondrial n=1 Tax=Echria macrotheca TaxID=438768 RepID=A0AAJ0FH06_9PEZI|nr:coenzyme Q-binding protein COQ10, mitochondrial [Echria macrotheca]